MRLRIGIVAILASLFSVPAIAQTSDATSLAGVRRLPAGCSIEEAVALLDIHTGSPEDVIESLEADSALARATDWTVQVHSIDPPHPHIMRSIELMAQVVAPALGWQPAAAVGIQ